ncbi:hypothetical protein SAMN04488498_1386 [Mesorhizobium albiziae]|uniref:VWFA domain-containing protein n=1 Tax=Neomesorhizobium albiziae TaxID=335020 RepID=A0A1I4F764_9HYPH|nr:hypothetical protein [Mesorhizobium albiziae]GLS29400.1 hypothetical protein GCM10007937_11080 [Mesorhizobium albiziae]SFL13359.1 hypothetical protein SAMN04488498_1386 [Mesorhizobium albiziae]
MARRGGRKKKKTNIGAVLGAGVLGLLSLGMIAGFAWMWSRTDKTEIVKGTNCPATGATSATVVIFDATDQLSPTTLTDLKNQFREIVGSVEKGGYLRVVSLTGRPGEIPLMFDACNPGDGADLDSWTGNPEMARRKWKQAFDEPLAKLPDAIANGTEAKQSPIMAAIQKVKLTVFDGEIGAGRPNRLFVASDMIEHTDLYSQYKAGPDYEKYAGSLAAKEYRTPLGGVDVSLLYVERPNRKFESLAHVEFWKQWVERQDGSFVKVIRLAGLNLAGAEQ